MAGKRKASDDAPGTPRPPAPRRETLSDEEELSPSAYLIGGDSGSDGEPSTSDGEELSPSAYLFIGDSGSDGEQSTREMVPPPPPPSQDPREMNVTDANLMFLERQERELSVNLRGRAARDYARGLSDGGLAAGEENEVSSPWRFVRLSELIVPEPPAADQSAAVRAEICSACKRWTAAMPWVPYRHVCLCVPCRHNPAARISCCICGAGRRSSQARTTSRP